MIKIVGDINLSDGFFDTGFGVGSSIKQGADPFKKLDRSDDDFWIGNFECVCADTSNKKGSHSKQFLISPRVLSHIKHLNMYGIANNHVMQHGDKAYKEMLDYFEVNNIQFVGNLNRKSTTFMNNGKKIGIIAFCQRPDNFTKTPLYWSLPEYGDIRKELTGLTNCDYKIVYVHWGNEFINHPYIDQKAFAHFLVDSGADLIVGMHPHVLQGFEIYKGKHIFYSLGNCVFNMCWNPTKYSIVVNIDVSSNFGVSYDYLKIEDDYFPRIVVEVPDSYLMENLNKLLFQTKENELYYKEVFNKTKQYKKANQKNIAKNINNIKFKDLITMFGDFINRRLK